MTTVAQLIEALQKLPPEAEIECGKEVRAAFDSYMKFVPVDVEDFTVCDYRDEDDRLKYPNMFGKVIVMINGV